MPEYEYKGKTMGGTQVSGVLKAKNQQDLERILRRNRILVSNIRKRPSQINIKIGTGIKRQDISRFTRQFA
ncbi:MAG: type II secretion system F family protein, partial [Candidatus Thorarchaeota archaeon]